MDPTTIAFGFLAGVLVGLTGMGGGALMGPVLILGLGVTPVIAVGVDLVYAAITKLFGAVIYWRRGSADLRLAGIMLLGSLPGALVGIALLAAARARGHDPNWLVAKVLGVALVIASLAMLLRLLFSGRPRPLRLALDSHWLIGAGFVVGLLVGISSVGSGTLLVAVLALATAMPSARIVGTDLVHGVLLTAPAGAVHAWLGHVDLGLTLTILVGSIPGILLGARLSAWSPEWVLRPVLAVVLMVVGLRLIG